MLKRAIFGSLAFLAMIGGIVQAVTSPPIPYHEGSLMSLAISVALVVLGIASAIKAFCTSAEEGFGVSAYEAGGGMPKPWSTPQYLPPQESNIKCRGDNFIIYK
jgi:hypothetical protein